MAIVAKLTLVGVSTLIVAGAAITPGLGSTTDGLSPVARSSMPKTCSRIPMIYTTRWAIQRRSRAGIDAWAYGGRAAKSFDFVRRSARLGRR
jgi:hypothetical protein